MTHVEVRTFTDLAHLIELEPDWRELEAAARPSSVFQHPSWLIAWSDVFGKDGTLRVHAAYRRGRLVGLAPLWISNTPRGPVAAFLGGRLNDFSDFLVHPEEPAAIVAALWLAVISSEPAWQFFELGPIRPDALLRSSGALPVPAGVRLDPGTPQPAPELTLGDSWETYRLGLDTRARRGWERSLERALATNVVMIRPVEDPATIGAELKRVETLRQANWAMRGRRDELVPVQRDPRFADFLAEVATRLARHSRCLLVELHLDDTLVAADLYLGTGHQVLLYLRMFQPQPAMPNPGMLLALLGLRFLHARGVRVVSFGRGAERYKYRFGARDIYLDRPTLLRVDR
jgi:CelD/BcsL family acetyltransferase involved in cellulose biosynthesis